MLGLFKTTRSFPKIPEEVRRRPKSAKGEVIEKTLIHKIRDREEGQGIVIYSFYTWFLFLTWVWVNIFLEIVSSKMATTHNFQSGVRNWPASVSWREVGVFNPQAWELAGIWRPAVRSQPTWNKTCMAIDNKVTIVRQTIKETITISELKKLSVCTASRDVAINVLLVT